MSLKHAILGLLNIQPMTGYTLKNEAFESTVAHFWQADQAQIYRTLDKMEADGWLSSEYEVQQDRPNKRVYSITEAGQAELVRWLGTEQSLPIYREPFLVQMFFAGLLPKDEILQQIEAHITGHKARLAQLEAIDMQIPPYDDAMARNRLFWGLTLELGIEQERMYLRWLEHCKSAISAAEHT